MNTTGVVEPPKGPRGWFQTLSRLEQVGLFFTAAVTLATIASVVLSFLAYISTEGRDRLELEQRAWLNVADGNVIGVFDPRKETRVELLITNTGRTPAKNVTSTICTVWSHLYPLPKDFAFPPNSDTNGVIGPNSAMRRYLTVHPFDPAEFANLKMPTSNSPLYLYVVGRVKYTDVFGKVHETTFCRYRHEADGVTEGSFRVAPHLNDFN